MPMKKKLITGCIVLLSVLLVVFTVFVSTRFSAYTTYEFLSGRVFDIDPTDVTQITVRSGLTGESVPISDRDELVAVVNLANQFRYKYWVPKLPIGISGWRYLVRIEFADGEKEDFLFAESMIVARGVYYYGSDKYFQPLISIMSDGQAIP